MEVGEEREGGVIPVNTLISLLCSIVWCFAGVSEERKKK